MPMIGRPGICLAKVMCIEQKKESHYEESRKNKQDPYIQSGDE
jgi:hypothetical protein